MAEQSLLAYTGAHLDAATGGYPLGNGYRWYLPGLMRFNAPDHLSPFGPGGVNPYAYCDANPINYSDPSGHSPLGLIVEAEEDVINDVVGAASPIPVRRAAATGLAAPGDAAVAWDAPGTVAGTAERDAARRAPRRPAALDDGPRSDEPQAKRPRADLTAQARPAAPGDVAQPRIGPGRMRFGGRLGQILDQAENDWAKYRGALTEEFLRRLPAGRTKATDSELREFSFFQKVENRSIGSGKPLRVSQLTGFTSEDDLAEFFGFRRGRYRVMRMWRDQRLQGPAQAGGVIPDAEGQDPDFPGVETLIFNYL